MSVNASMDTCLLWKELHSSNKERLLLLFYVIEVLTSKWLVLYLGILWWVVSLTRDLYTRLWHVSIGYIFFDTLFEEMYANTYECAHHFKTCHWRKRNNHTFFFKPLHFKRAVRIGQVQLMIPMSSKRISFYINQTFLKQHGFGTKLVDSWIGYLVSEGLVTSVWRVPHYGNLCTYHGHESLRLCCMRATTLLWMMYSHLLIK